MNTVNYMHNTLAEIYGTDDYASVMKTPMQINPLRKNAIDKAFSESKNKSTFKRLVKQYTGLTVNGIKEEPYVQELLKTF